MLAKELRSKSEPDLQKQLASWRERLRDLNFRIANKQVKNYREHKKLREDIARILTVMHEKQSAKLVAKPSK